MLKEIRGSIASAQEMRFGRKLSPSEERFYNTVEASASENYKKKFLFNSLVSFSWVDGPFVKWETRYLTNPQLTRSAFADAFCAQSQDPQLWDCVTQMWANQMFDSVSSNGITVHGITVVTDHMLPIKDEKDYDAGSANLGRINLPYSVCNKGWGLEPGQMIAVRGKINGLSFVRVKTESGVFLRGPWDVEISDDVPLQKVEFYGGKWYIIAPYGLPTFSLNGVVYNAHPWLHPMDFHSNVMYDGIMVLTADKEYRVKFYHTHETLINDVVWEVTTLGGIMLRQRPGKAVSSSGVIHSNLASVNVAVLSNTFPVSRIYKVVLCDYGRRQATGILANTYVIDSGYRVLNKTVKIESKFSYNIGPVDDNYPVMVVNGQMDDLVFGEVISEPRKFAFPIGFPTGKSLPSTIPQKSYIGSKVILGCAGLSSHYMYLERGKKMDFVGGNHEGMETPEQTLVREIQEELGCSLSNIRFLGYSEHNDKGVYARSYVFFCRIDKDLLSDPTMNDIFHRLHIYQFKMGPELDEVMQPWVRRHLNYVLDFFSVNKAMTEWIFQHPGGRPETMKELITYDQQLPLATCDVLNDGKAYHVSYGYKNKIDVDMSLIAFDGVCWSVESQAQKQYLNVRVESIGRKLSKRKAETPLLYRSIVSGYVGGILRCEIGGYYDDKTASQRAACARFVKEWGIGDRVVFIPSHMPW